MLGSSGMLGSRGVAVLLRAAALFAATPVVERDNEGPLGSLPEPELEACTCTARCAAQEGTALLPAFMSAARAVVCMEVHHAVEQHGRVRVGTPRTSDPAAQDATNELGIATSAVCALGRRNPE